MKIVRWNPRYPSLNTFNEFDRLVDNMLSWPRREPAADMRLALDVTENDDAFVVKASVPGIAAENIDVSLEENVLTIKGAFEKDNTEEEENYRLRERHSGSFSRRLRFPVDVNAEAVEANYENGVLSLTVPKLEEVKPKRVEIKVA